MYLSFAQNPNDPTMLSDCRNVAYVEDFFSILEEVHCQEKSHVDGKKTVAEVGIESPNSTLRKYSSQIIAHLYEFLDI